MSKLLLILATTAAGMTGGAALGHPAGGGPGLPDFPRDAQPGGCYARLPAGGMAPGRSGAGPAVWILRRGTGATAVWSYSHGGEVAHDAAAGPLQWVQVDCGNGRPIAEAHALTVAPPPLPPLADMRRPGHAHGSGHAGPPPPPPPPMMPPPTALGEDLGPYADPSPALHALPPPADLQGPDPRFGPGPSNLAPPMAGGPYALGAAPGRVIRFHMRRPAGPTPPPSIAFAPAPAPVAPWFGGRMLSWPGKTFR